MCTVSAIHDNWNDRLPGRYPWVYPSTGTGIIPDHVTREEIDSLKAEIAELRRLLEAAKKFDEATDQPDCESDEKTETLRKIQELLGQLK